ncbi:MAG TPA: SRPBCC family protein [Mycobacteriales bacterium]|nr:SRPBCC family protein [Mycobacteriales bacterium]
MTQSVQSSVSHDTFVIVRTYEAPVAAVFRAWADPRRKAQWFTGSAEALGNGYELDFRVGGHERFSGRPHPDAPVYTYDADLHDIVDEQRIVYSYEMYADDDRISVSVATVEFSEPAGTTQLTVTEQGVFLDGHDTSAQREAGTVGLLGSLATYLAADG